MSFLAIQDRLAQAPKHWREIRFKRAFTPIERRAGHSGTRRLSLASAGHLYPREGALDRQQASDATEARSLIVEPGDLVINPMWLTGGSIAVSGLFGAVSPDYRVFRPTSQVHPRYAHHLLRSQPYMDQYRLFVRANTTFDRRIQQVDLDAMPMALPPLEEQQRIANFLDDQVARIDRIIAARRDQINLLDEALTVRIRSAVAGVFSGVVGEARAELPWVSSVAPDAKVVALARVLVLQRGVDLTEDQRRPGDVPVVTTAGVVGTHDVAAETGPGVVIGRYGSVGNVHWVEGPYWPHNTTLYVKDTLGNDLRWIYYLLRSFPYGAMQARAAIPGVNRNDMATELVPWISVAKQRASAEWLDSETEGHSTQRHTLAGSIDLLSEFKSSLITASVAGELDVTTAGGGIPA